MKLRTWTIGCLFMAVSCVWAVPAARVHDPPPTPCCGGTVQDGKPLIWFPGPCVASFGSVSVPSTQPARSWVTNGKVWWWEYTWNWSYVYDCNAGFTPSCRMCNRVEIDYQNSTTGQWFVAPFGIINGPTSSSTCNTEITVSMQDVWGSPTPAGTAMRANWLFAPWDSTVSADCFGQDYQQRFQYQWTIPPNP